MADDGFFLARVPQAGEDTLTIVLPPDAKEAETRDGQPNRSFVPSRIADLTVSGEDDTGQAVAHGVVALLPGQD